MNPRSVLTRVPDAALDRVVVAGYSRLGFLLRRRWWPGADPPPGALRGKIALVTGANSGIGKAISLRFARLGATVIMVVRDTGRGDAARREILASAPGADLRVVCCDVSDLADIRALTSDLRDRLPRVDIAIHNAGVLPYTRSETAQGHELTFATHVLGPLLLTEELTSLLASSTDARVVFISSGGMYAQPLRADDPEYLDGRYRGAAAYARTKRMQVALLPVLADRWLPYGVTVAAMHPGWVDTPGVASSLPGFHRLTAPILRTSDQGADTAVWLTATTPAPPTGRFWHDRAPRPEHYVPITRFNEQDRQRLWRHCRSAAGL